jgi:xanthine dehydrogenase YagR molybdenum-binding subunit
MIWGVSFALHEHAVMDLRSGRPNPNLGEYHVPVNADVPSLEAILVDEHDPYVNALGINEHERCGALSAPAGYDTE